VQSIALNQDGSVLMAGDFGPGNASFIGPNSTNTAPQSSYFLAKYDPLGNLVWTQFEDWFAGGYLGLATDHAGDFYVCGYTNRVYGDEPCNVVLTKYDRLGNRSWNMSSQGNGYGGTDDGLQIVLDSSTNIYMAGIFGSSNFMLGGILLTNAGAPMYNDEFVAKFDPAGTPLWARAVYGADPDDCSISVDPEGNLFAVGTFSAPLKVGSNIILTNSGQSDLYVIKFDSAGNVLWAERPGVNSPLGTLGSAGTVYAAGNLYVGGLGNSSTGYFGNFALPHQTGAYLAKLDPNGSVLWVVTPQIDATFNSRCAVFADAAGNAYEASGEYQGATGNAVKYDRMGNMIWNISITNADAYELVGDAYGNLYVGGKFWNTSQFGAIPMRAANPGEIFLARLDGPQVSLTTSGNQSVVSWPTNATGLSLESTTELRSGTWSPVTNSPGMVGSQYVITNSISTGAQFYRLRNF